MSQKPSKDNSLDSVLEKHTINLDDKQKTQVTFYSYYNATSAIHYELNAIIKVFKFTNEAAKIAAIPQNWVKTVESFNDSKFGRKCSPSALFAEASAIAFLIALCENRSLTTTITNMYNICIRKTENDRVQRINAKLTDLQASINKMNLNHGAKHSLIKDAIEVVADNHGIIQNVLQKLITNLEH
ncbi:OrNV gp013-like protein [Tomelloso virus]|uniref:OrNV gp013-like protein n=1 Tax=Tomelloso virus TaxID=2053981 RepID=A0A2H4T2U4_9VIRU|nr:OrNV gp013-like protein [Tomelloso virus]ATY70246.1 OrNV gp013-like protein [Tomelloso virus]